MAARIEALKEKLLSREEVLAVIQALCRERRDREAFWLALERREEGVVVSFFLREPGYLTCLWIDEDGVGEWTPTEASRGSKFWEPLGDREHRLRPVKVSSRSLTAIAFLTRSRLSFRERGLVPVRPAVAAPAAGGVGEAAPGAAAAPAAGGEEARLEELGKLRRLHRFVAELLGRGGGEVLGVDLVRAGG